MFQSKFFLTAITAVSLAACSAPPPDYAAELKPATDAFIETWNTGNFALLDDAVPDNFRRAAPNQVANSRAELEAVITALRTAYPDMQVTINDAEYTEDRAFLRWNFTGTNTGPGEVPPTGKAVTGRGATILEFADGKIAFEDVYFDVLEWYEQLGATLSGPGADMNAMQAAVDAYVAAWNTGDMALLDDSTTEDFKRTDPAGNGAESREEMKGVMTALRTAYPDAKVVISNVAFADDRAFLNWTFTGTHTGPGDMAPTNNAVELDGYTIAHFRGDKMEYEEVYFDVLAWMTQLGAKVTPPGS